MPKIFISWSGDDSHAAAEALYTWLPVMLHSIKPFISSEDLRKGGRWNADLASELEQTNFGIICVTPSSLEAPWLLFEAGALSKVISESHVAPLLFKVKPSELARPLTQFNATNFDKEDFRKLVRSINQSNQADTVKEDLLNRSFEAIWPSLEAEVNKAVLPAATKPPASKATAARDEKTEAILEELLVLARSQAQLLGSPHTLFPAEAVREIIDNAPRNRALPDRSHAVWRDLSQRLKQLELTAGLIDDEKGRRVVEAGIVSLRAPIDYIFRRLDYREAESDRSQLSGRLSRLRRNMPSAIELNDSATDEASEKED